MDVLKNSFTANLDEGIDFSQIEKIPLPFEPSHEAPKSSSLETLISQNEDLVARLNVTLRRLAIMEEENSSLQKQMREINFRDQALQDQFLVWKEKESFWIKKSDSLEKKKAEMQEQLKFLSIENENKNETQKSLRREIERYKKYHEKIKQQIKPYIQQLKNFAQSLNQELRTLQYEVDHRDFRLNQLENSIKDLKINYEQQLKKSGENQSLLIQHFETEREFLTVENENLKTSKITLQERLSQYEGLQENFDHLQNELIQLKRQLEVETNQYITEQNQREQELQILKNNLHLAKSEKNQQEEQLITLRMLWKQKNDEFENLKMSHQTLEQINQELSRLRLL